MWYGRLVARRRRAGETSHGGIVRHGRNRQRDGSEGVPGGAGVGKLWKRYLAEWARCGLWSSEDLSVRQRAVYDGEQVR